MRFPYRKPIVVYPGDGFDVAGPKGTISNLLSSCHGNPFCQHDVA